MSLSRRAGGVDALIPVNDVLAFPGESESLRHRLAARRGRCLLGVLMMVTMPCAKRLSLVHQAIGLADIRP